MITIVRLVIILSPLFLLLLRFYLGRDFRKSDKMIRDLGAGDVLLEVPVIGVVTSSNKLVRFQYAVLLLEEPVTGEKINIVTHQWSEPYVNINPDLLPKMTVICTQDGNYIPQIEDWLLCLENEASNAVIIER